jgi:class 3 adenylate cyclase
VQLVSAADLERFRRRYMRLFETALERDRSALSAELLVLLQLALLRWLLGVAERENETLQREYQRAESESPQVGPHAEVSAQKRLELLKRQAPAINRRVLKLLFRQIRRLETGPLSKLRSSVSTEAWPLPQQAFFNPVLMVPEPGEILALAADYPVASLGEDDDGSWLQLANTTLVQVFHDYLPDFCRRGPHGERASRELLSIARAERDQSLRAGLLGSELLLSEFLSPEEYRSGQVSWIDEPANLRRFLTQPEAAAGDEEVPAPGSSLGSSPAPSQGSSPRWQAFRRSTRALLHRRLEQAGVTERIVLCFWLPTLRAQLGGELPFSLLVEHCIGRMPRRSPAPRLASLGIDVDAGMQALQRAREGLARMGQADRAPYLDRFLADFLVLRRDLKLAYKTYEAMDRLRLLEHDDDIKLSRSNGSLHEFVDRKEAMPLLRRIRAHAVVKADIRGSTRITDELAARGLNPASHFSLNLFHPVNRLLPEFGAEKLFVEGDAVILALYEYESQAGSASGVHPVARACGLASRILQLVAEQNVQNRQHGLPELELGLGIAFSPREPHFLYDEGRRIVISSAINTADRLSSCASVLRAAGIAPPGQGQRVLVLRNASAPMLGGGGEALLCFNVNGIHLDQTAFFALQREIPMRQARLTVPGDEDGLYFLGSHDDGLGRVFPVAVRCAPVRDWNGREIGDIEPEHRHYFEVIVDDAIAAGLRK